MSVSPVVSEVRAARQTDHDHRGRRSRSAVSLALLGVGLLLGKQINVMKDYWYDKVEVAVYLTPECRLPTADALNAELTADPLVSKVTYESQQHAYQRFKHQFKNPGPRGRGHPGELPEAFRVKMKDPRQYRPDLASGSPASLAWRRCRTSVNCSRDSSRCCTVHPDHCAGDRHCAGSRGLGADQQHDPGGGVQPPPRDVGSCAWSGRPTVHPVTVRARRRARGPRRRGPGDRCDRRREDLCGRPSARPRTSWPSRSWAGSAVWGWGRWSLRSGSSCPVPASFVTLRRHLRA